MRLSSLTRASAAPLLALLTAAFAACSSSDGTGVDDQDVLPAELVGSWDATSMVVTAKADSTVRERVVQDQGGTFTLELRSEGRYVATLTVFGHDRTERGDVEVSGSQLVFRPDDGPSDRVDWSLTAGVLTLDGETTHDFNQDGTEEEALLHLELEKG